MKNKKNILVGTLLTGALLAAGSMNANQSSSLTFNHLGSGGEVRSNLLERALSGNRFIELTCSGNAATDKKDSTKTDAKAKDGKCGEGKCGEGKCGDKKDAKVKAKAKAATNDGKAKDAKCGEGKCGDKKAPK